MRETDDRAAAVAISELFAHAPVPQFWDGQRLLGLEVSRSLGLDRVGLGPAWDVYLFYPPGPSWTDAGMPPPEKAIAQTAGVVIGLRGTLPPKGDQALVPEWGVGFVDVVGEQSELAALLGEIASGYAGSSQGTAD